MTSLHPLHQHEQTRARFTARLIGRSACVFGYPLVEMLRMCRVQTCAKYERSDVDRTAIDTLRHSASPPVAGQSRPSEGQAQRFSTAWLWMARGARHVVVPWAATTSATAYCLSFYDAFGDHIADIDQQGAREAGIILIGPHTPRLRDGIDFHTIQCPTHLVWMVGSFRSREGSPAALQRLQSTMRILGPVGTLNGQRPAAVELWEGDTTNSFVDLVERGRAASALAPDFYANFCRALAHLPYRDEDEPVRDMLPSVGLEPNAALNWKALDAEVRAGLIAGFEDAAHAVKVRASLAMPDRAPHEHGHMARAVAAYRGIGV